VGATPYHQITAFRVMKGTWPSAPPVHLDLSGSLGVTTHYGEVSLGAVTNNAAVASSVGEIIKVQNMRVYSWGSFVFLLDLDTSVSMLAPKGMVGDMAMYVMGRPRTPDSFRNCCSYARTVCKKYNMPPELVVKAGYAATALGFVENVVMELSVMNSVIRPMIPLIDAHSSALEFKFQPKITWKKLVATVIAVGALGGAAAVAVSSWPVIGAAAAAAIAAGSGLVAAAGAAAAAHIRSRKDVFASYKKDRSANPLKDRSVPITSAPLPSTPPAKTIEEILATPIDPMCKLQVRDAYATKETKAPNTIVPGGIVSTVSPPIVPENSAHSSLSAIVGRILKLQGCKTEDFDWIQFKAWELYWDRHILKLFPSMQPGEMADTLFHVWNARFPAHQQKRHLVAYRIVLSEGLSKSDNSVGMFVKVEGNSKSTTDEVPSFTPRAIQSRKAAHNVETGPHMHAFSRLMKHDWNPRRKYGLVYSSGLTAEQIGGYFDDSFRLIEEPECIEGDYERYDASVHGKKLKKEAKVHQTLSRNPNIEKALLRSIFTVGYDKFGNKFASDGERHSGDSNTSNGNTLNQGMDVVFCAAVQQVPRPEFTGTGLDLERQIRAWVLTMPDPEQVFEKTQLRALLLGDDSLLLFKKGTIDVTKFTLSLRGLGHELEAKKYQGEHDIRLYATFCSARFYPVQASGQRKVILAPPIGRVMARAGYFTNPPKNIPLASLVRGDATSRMQDASGIPFLRPYWKRILALTKGVKAAKVRRDNQFLIHTSRAYEPSAETYAHVEELYGLTRKDEEKWISDLGKIKELPHCLDRTMFARAFELDGMPVDGPSVHVPAEVPNIPPASTVPLSLGEYKERHRDVRVQHPKRTDPEFHEHVDPHDFGEDEIVETLEAISEDFEEEAFPEEFKTYEGFDFRRSGGYTREEFTIALERLLPHRSTLIHWPPSDGEVVPAWVQLETAPFPPEVKQKFAIEWVRAGHQPYITEGSGGSE